MREILFRGKRIDNGEWVYGGLIHRTDYYGEPVDEYVIVKEGDFDFDYYIADDVDPDTVSEFTGLYDKNGKRIFEGDIVKFSYDHTWELDKEHYATLNYGEVAGVVGYDDEVGYGWEITIPSIRWDEEEYLGNYRDGCGGLKVCGNKWDNPELLGKPMSVSGDYKEWNKNLGEN